MRDLAFYIVENGKPPAKQYYLYRAGQKFGSLPPRVESNIDATF
jgi:hypothetical protein